MEPMTIREILQAVDGRMLGEFGDLNREVSRVETDSRNEKIGYKIREAQLQKIPYMLIIGDKEAESGTVSVRMRGEGDIGAMAVDDFLARALLEVAEKKR